MFVFALKTWDQIYEPRKKNRLLSIESWLVNKDSYNGLLQSLYKWVVFHPLYTLTNQVFFIAHIDGFAWMNISYLRKDIKAIY